MNEIVVVASSSTDAASALARKLAAQGARVAMLVATHGGHLPELARDVVAAGSPEVIAVPCDLVDTREVAAAAARVERELGPIDRWVNSRLTDVGTVTATRAALHCMQPRDRGTIVQVDVSQTARIYTDAIRAELRAAGSHIRVDTVRRYPFRRVGAGLLAAAAGLGALLLRRVLR
jgi:NAD(P)-dependent dehydrogenase (short-subunit alcohol dehydrogenase family)